MNLEPLRNLLGRINSYETCSKIVAETSRLSRDSGQERWYFLLLNRTFVWLIDEPDMFYGVSENNPSPTLRAVWECAVSGIDAIERGDSQALKASANRLTSRLTSLRNHDPHELNN